MKASRLFSVGGWRGVLAVGGAAGALVAIAPRLQSEQFTLFTYYPAPSGVYTNMVATGDAYLARDGGGVSVGTPQNPAGAKLVVMGGAVGVGTVSPVTTQDGRSVGLHVADSLIAGDVYMSNPAYGNPRWASQGGPPALSSEFRLRRPAGVDGRSTPLRLALGRHHVCYLTGFKSWAADSDMYDGCRVVAGPGAAPSWTLETYGHPEDPNECRAQCMDWGAP